jgi:hypothetical protein
MQIDAYRPGPPPAVSEFMADMIGIFDAGSVLLILHFRSQPGTNCQTHDIQNQGHGSVAHNCGSSVFAQSFELAAKGLTTISAESFTLSTTKPY